MRAPLNDPDVHVPLGEKLAWVFGLTLFCGAGFLAIAKLNGVRAAAGWTYTPLETSLDRLIPFQPGWIWVYMSYWPACFLPLAAWRRGVLFRRVAMGFGLQFGACFPFFAFMPARMSQPVVTGATLSERAVRMLYGIDPGFNIFPSLHVANILLVAAVMWRVDRRLGALTWVWAALMSWSVLAVKQHYSPDVAAGAALGLVSVAIIFRAWDGLWPAERAQLLERERERWREGRRQSA